MCDIEGMLRLQQTTSIPIHKPTDTEDSTNDNEQLRRRFLGLQEIWKSHICICTVYMHYVYKTIVCPKEIKVGFVGVTAENMK